MARLAPGYLLAANLVGPDCFRLNKGSARYKHGGPFEHVDDIGVLHMHFAYARLVAVARVNHVLVTRVEQDRAFLESGSYFPFLKVSDRGGRGFRVRAHSLECIGSCNRKLFVLLGTSCPTHSD